MKRQIPADMPTMPALCKTCPFAEGGDIELRNRVVERTLFKASQLCHCSAVDDQPETHLCRDALEFQATILYRMGMIDEPTDEAFRAKSKEALGDARRSDSSC